MYPDAGNHHEKSSEYYAIAELEAKRAAAYQEAAE